MSQRSPKITEKQADYLDMLARDAGFGDGGGAIADAGVTVFGDWKFSTEKGDASRVIDSLEAGHLAP